MTGILRRTGWALSMLLVLLVATSTARAQRGGRKPPRISYASPAGVQRGQSVEITVGGQYLTKVDKILVSGDGVTGIVGLFQDPHSLAAFLVLALGFSAGMAQAAFRSENRGAFAAHVALLAATAIALVYTNSRGGLVAAILAGMVWGGLYLLRRRADRTGTSVRPQRIAER